ncbi:MAG: methyltransferase [Jatrophihabitans sp.]|uniref:methyltransferase n=1 Tax=Jatrophihabitans sp. TaxID=1932789 RepID=UPI003F7DA887
MDTPPPPVQMVQLLAGFQISQALYAAARLGLPDALTDGPRTAAEIAHVRQTDPAATSRLLRSLASLGVFTVDGDRYDLTPLGRTLTSDSPGSMRDLALMWMETHYAPFGGLVDTVRTGATAATTHYGQPFFGWLAGQPEQLHRFAGAMANLTGGIKLGAVDTHDFGAPRRLVDLGGSDGTLLAHVLQRLPGTEGVVLDRPEVVVATEARRKGHGLGDRLAAVGGDFFDRVPASDAYLISMVLHDWDDEHALRLLQTVARDAEPGAVVHMVELVVPPGATPHMATMIDLTMLGMLDGRERREDEFRTLVEAAGLVFGGVETTPTPISVLTARVPG